MDYGKTAYLKTIDLERRLNLGVSESQYDSYLELSKGLVDETFSGSLPAFLAAFTSEEKLTAGEIAEIHELIDRAGE